jgi:iron uptake system EfeUOB component EfeO/EfeM
MLSFVLEAGKMSGVLQSFSNLNDLLAKYQNRDAYKKAIELGGKYTLGK